MLVKSFFFLCCFFVITLSIGMFRGEHGIFRFFELKVMFEELTKNVQRIAEDNFKIEEEIKKIRNSPSYAKKILREKFNELDEGERLIISEE